MKKAKNIIICILGAGLFAAGFYLLKTTVSPEGIIKTLPFLLIGCGCGLFGHGVGDMVNKSVSEKNPGYAKQKEIAKKDERNIMLNRLSKAKGYDMMTYVFAALMLAYALMGLSIEIILPFVISYLFVECYTVYIRIKKDQEY